MKKINYFTTAVFALVLMSLIPSTMSEYAKALIIIGSSLIWVATATYFEEKEV